MEDVKPTDLGGCIKSEMEKEPQAWDHFLIFLWPFQTFNLIIFYLLTKSLFQDIKYMRNKLESSVEIFLFFHASLLIESMV